MATVVIMLYFKDKNLTTTQIAFWSSLIGLPWMLKPFWAPFLERVRAKKHIVIATQFFTAFMFGCIAFAFTTTFWYQLSIIFLFVLAFIAATHDIAADGVYMLSQTEGERAANTGFQSAFWMLGKALSVGGFVWLAGALVKTLGVDTGWAAVFGLFGLTMLCFSLYHVFLLPPGVATDIKIDTEGEKAGFITVVKDFFKKPHIGEMILFIFLYRFAYAQVEKIGPLFLKSSIETQGLGLSMETIGTLYGGFATGGMLLGSIIGGKAVERFSLKKSLLTLATLLNVPIVIFIYLAWLQPSNLWIVGTCLTIELFCMGIGMVGGIVFMMNQVAPGRFPTAHYGFATALMGAGVMIPGMLSGWVCDHIGFKWFFVYALIAAIPSFYVAWRVPFREDVEEGKSVPTK